MTEQESKAYLKSVWESVAFFPDNRVCILNSRVETWRSFDNESLAVAYTQKLLAEIAEVKEEIEMLKRCEPALSVSGFALLERVIEKRLRPILAEKRAGMKEGK